MQGPPQAIEFFHGYTYSANPLAYSAAIESGAERIALVVGDVALGRAVKRCARVAEEADHLLLLAQ